MNHRAGLRRHAAFVALLVTPILGGATCWGTREAPQRIETAKVTMGPGDVVEVRVFGEPELSGVYIVGVDGSVRLPLVGNLPVNGLTPDEMQGHIETAYNAKYLKNAQVTVLAKEFNSRKIYVVGAVGRPGAFPFATRMTVLDAILAAGGTSQIADANGTIITRRSEKGDLERLRVAVAAIGKGNSDDVELQPGDIVFVPETLF